ncbi:MAG: ArsR/SmtB family transcription factor [Caulobacterales bacterium]
MTYELTLDALADPTRRKVFERLKAGPLPVGEIAAGLPVSRPAVSQHLRVLKQAGLVHDQQRGTARLYAIHRPGLAALRDWVESFWDEPLAHFKNHAEGNNGKK